MLEGNRNIYRREDGGAWVSILTPAEAAALVFGSVYISSFCADPAVDGRLWVLFGTPSLGWDNRYWAAYSEDYGDTWTATAAIYGGPWT